MEIGEQLVNPTAERLRLSRQLGVRRVVVDNRPNTHLQGPDGVWDADKVADFRRWVESFGLSLECTALDVGSFLTDTIYAPERARERARRLEGDIAAAARAGLTMLKYNLQMVGITRTDHRPGRGGVRESAFRVEDYAPERDARHSYWGAGAPTTRPGAEAAAGQRLAGEVGTVSVDQAWAAIAALVEVVVPAAERCGIRLAVHPQDPAYPADGLNGVHHVVGSLEGMERLLDLAPASPVHGLNFCQGTIAEMSRDPNAYVLEAIRRIGARERIFMVHFRNIKGGYLDFSECFPDEGAVDMAACIRAYRELGYMGVLCPDHVPASELDPEKERFFAFALGYTRGLLQAA